MNTDCPKRNKYPTRTLTHRRNVASEKNPGVTESGVGITRVNT